MWVRKSTPRPSRASPTATFKGLPPTCSPVTLPVPLDDVDQRLADHQRPLRCAGHGHGVSFRSRRLQCRAGSVAVQRVQRPQVRLDEPRLRREIAEHLGVFDERGRVARAASGPAAPACRRAGPGRRSARPARRRPRRIAPSWPRSPPTAGPGHRRRRFARMTGSSHFGMRSDEPKHSRTMVSLHAGVGEPLDQRALVVGQVDARHRLAASASPRNPCIAAGIRRTAGRPPRRAPAGSRPDTRNSTGSGGWR